MSRALCTVIIFSFTCAAQEPSFRFAAEDPEPSHQQNSLSKPIVNVCSIFFNDQQFKQHAINYHNAAVAAVYALHYVNALLTHVALPDFSAMHLKLPNNFKDSFKRRSRLDRWFTKDVEKAVHERTLYHQLIRQCGQYFTITQLVQHQYACMRDWKQYSYHGFRSFIRTFPLYEEYILELNAEFKSNQKLITQVKNVESRAYEYITQEAYRINQKRNHEKIQRARSVAAYNYEQRQLRSQEFFKEQIFLLENYFVECVESNPNRFFAYQQTINNNVLSKKCSYSLSSQAQKYLTDNGIDTIHYTTVQGNDFQHQLHQEIMHGIEKIATIARPSDTQSFDYMMHSSTLNTFDVACRVNEMGDCMSAIKLIDLGSAMVDYCVAVAQGVFEGAVEGTKEAIAGTYHMVRHPIDSVKALWNVALKIGSIIHDHLPLYKPYFLCSTDQEKQMALAYHQELVDHWAQAEKKLVQWWNETPTREKLHEISKNSSNFLTNVFVVGKCLNMVGKVCTIASTEALALCNKSNPKALVVGTNFEMPVELIALSDAEKIIEKPATVLLENIEQSLIQLHSQQRRQFNFSVAAAKQMDRSVRMIPLHIIDGIITDPIAILSDPRGSSALMYYSKFCKNGKMYNAEILYHEPTNTIYHFLYQREKLGPLPRLE